MDMKTAEPRSLFKYGLVEAERHKYLESEKAGRDLGTAAIDDWHRRHWTRWLRHRWLEHLLGTRRWAELEPWRFGRLATLFTAHLPLLQDVADMVRRGAENIDILCWAARQHRGLHTVERMLVELRLNEIRCSRQCVAFARLAMDMDADPVATQGETNHKTPR